MTTSHKDASILSMDIQTILSNSLIGLLVVVFIFLIFREIITWYWKINRRIELLEKIDNNLEYIARLLKAQAPANIEDLIDKGVTENPNDKSV